MCANICWGLAFGVWEGGGGRDTETQTFARGEIGWLEASILMQMSISGTNVDIPETVDIRERALNTSSALHSVWLMNICGHRFWVC